MSLKAHFTKTLARPGAALHFAAHSHHPWPDVTEAAQIACWDDAARLLDGKWAHIFNTVLPQAQRHVARVLNLPDPSSIVFAPNTHEFVRRLLSALPERPRILTSDAEFHSFTRQIARLEEDGLVQVTRVSALPLADFTERFCTAAAQDFDMIFVSSVFFNSGFVWPWRKLLNEVRRSETFVVLDGYHAFMAVPEDLSDAAQRLFYIAGGYKYAMAGEGACFMHCPPGYGPRPRDTGWYAAFGALSGPQGATAYAKDASRFAGATYDPSGLYRFNAVQNWWREVGRSVALDLDDVRRLQRQFLTGQKLGAPLTPLEQTGRFITIRRPDAARIEAALAADGIIIDRRDDRLRFGFGIYQDDGDVSRLLTAVNALA